MPDDTSSTNEPQQTPNAAPSPDTGEAPTTSGPTTDDAQRHQDRATDGRFEPKDWRYPADYHVEWMRGRTAEEVGNLSQQLYQQLLTGQSGNVQGQYQGQAQTQGWQPQAQTQWGQQPQAAPPQAPSMTPQPPTSDDWQMDPGAAAAKQQAYMDHVNQQRMSGLYGTLGQTARALAQQRYPDDFKRWGPEIDMYINQLDLSARTPDMIDNVVKLVRGQHIDEIANEKVKEAINRAQEAGGLRSDAAAGASAGGGSSLNFNMDELPQGYREWLKRNDVTESTLREFLNGPAGSLYGGATYQERVKNFVETAKKGGDVIVEPTRKVQTSA